MTSKITQSGAKLKKKLSQQNKQNAKIKINKSQRTPYSKTTYLAIKHKEQINNLCQRNIKS